MSRICSSLKVALCLTLLVSGRVLAADGDASVLTIGSKAPALDVEHWVSNGNGQFKPVTEFEKDKIYIVEFWATWCGPCIGSMPHLVEMQNAHAKDGVQIVSISDEDMDTVSKFLERKYVPRGQAEPEEGEEAKGPATYGELTSAYCLTTDPDESCYEDYMRAAGQNGIPCCFLVGKSGVVEWIGHPMAIDPVLESVIADKWDRSVFAKEFAVTQKVDLATSQAMGLVQEKDFDGAIAAFEAVRPIAKGQALQQIDFYVSRIKQIQLQSMVSEGKTDEALKMIDAQLEAAEEAQKSEIYQLKYSVLMMAERQKEAAVVLETMTEKMEPDMLNQVAWTIYEATQQDNAEIATELVQAATAAAEKAVKAQPKNAAILDTLAHLVYVGGDLQRAIKIQTDAVKYQDPPSEDISSFLQKLKKEAAEKDGK